MPTKRERFAKRLDATTDDYAGIIAFLAIPKAAYTRAEVERIVCREDPRSIVNYAIRERLLTPYRFPNGRVDYFQHDQVAQLVAILHVGELRHPLLAAIGTGVSTLVMPTRWLIQFAREIGKHGWTRDYEDELKLRLYRCGSGCATIGG